MSAQAALDALLDFEAVKGSLAALAALEGAELSTGDLSERLGIADQTATKLRKHLEANGLIIVVSRKARGATEYGLSLTAPGRRAAKLATELGRILRKAG